MSTKPPAPTPQRPAPLPADVHRVLVRALAAALVRAYREAREPQLAR